MPSRRVGWPPGERTTGAADLVMTPLVHLGPVSGDRAAHSTRRWDPMRNQPDLRVGAISREGRQVSDTADSSRGRARCRPRWRGPSHHTDGPTCPESPGLRTASESTKHLADILDEPTWTQHQSANGPPGGIELNIEDESALEFFHAAASVIGRRHQFLGQEVQRTLPQHGHVVRAWPSLLPFGLCHQRVSGSVCQRTQPCPFGDRTPFSLQYPGIPTEEEAFAVTDQLASLGLDAAVVRPV